LLSPVTQWTKKVPGQAMARVSALCSV